MGPNIHTNLHGQSPPIQCSHKPGAGHDVFRWPMAFHYAPATQLDAEAVLSVAQPVKVPLTLS